MALGVSLILLGALLLVAALLFTSPARAAPQIPASLDVGAARIVVEGTPIPGQYVVMCQRPEGPYLTGPWALEAGLTASFPMEVGRECWVQVSEDREGEQGAVWATPRWTVRRAWLPEVGQ
jgi:hypothetical protein